MSDLEYRPKQRGSGWAWLMVLVAVLAVIWILVAWLGQRRSAAATRETSTTAAEIPLTTVATSDHNSGTAITDLLPILSTADPTTLIGKRVQLLDAPVQTVLGDRSFTIGPDRKDQLLVVLDGQPTPGTPIERRVDVDHGDVVDVTGTIQSIPPVETARREWQLGGMSDREIQNRPILVHAEKVTRRAAKRERKSQSS
ncbi:MAG: hypothetical protein WBX15_08765 [Thermoanaerobaculia bacterium]